MSRVAKSALSRASSACLILVCLLAVRVGCGPGPTVLQPVNVSAAARARIATVTHFGDSVTCGALAYPHDGVLPIRSKEGFAGLLDMAIGRPAENFCFSGDRAADMARVVNARAVPKLGAHQLYTVLIGVNDANGCGPAAGCRDNFRQTMLASLAWLAIPASDKVLAAAAETRTGTWNADVLFGSAQETRVSGSTLSFSVRQAVAGRSVYVAYRVFDSSVARGGAATVLVDGVAVAALSADSGAAPIATQNGVHDTVFVAAVPLGGVGLHHVAVRVSSPDGAAFSLLWVGTPTGSYASMEGAPRVVVGGIPATTDPELNQVVSRYNVLLGEIVAGLVGDGMNIQVAPTATALNPGSDMEDKVHPNNAGHHKLAAAFAGVL